MGKFGWIPALLIVVASASAQPVAPPRPPADPLRPPTTADRRPTDNAFNDALASAGQSTTQPGSSYIPGFFGDFLGGFIVTRAFDPVQQQDLIIGVPSIAQASGMKIAETDSPMPMDRVYYAYNGYAQVDVSPNPLAPFLNVHRHVVGFEKTMFGNKASVGMRLPFFNFTGSPIYDDGFTGDLSVVAKVSLLRNPVTGGTLSTGLVITVPTGGTPLLITQPGGGRTPAPRTYPVYLQPYIGYIYSSLRWLYLHAFHAVAIPTDSAEATFMSNSLGVGIWLLREPEARWLRGILPTVEVHANTPFTRRTPAPVPGASFMRDSVNLTTGFYAFIRSVQLGAAVGVPLLNGTYPIEGLASITWRF